MPGQKTTVLQLWGSIINTYGWQIQEVSVFSLSCIILSFFKLRSSPAMEYLGLSAQVTEALVCVFGAK